MYTIQASITHYTTDRYGVSVANTRQVPMFFLDENIQGIMSEEHAKQIARDIIIPIPLMFETFSIDILATKESK